MHGFNGAGGRVVAAGLPESYRNITLTNSPARADQADIYRLLTDYAATFGRQFEAAADRIKSLYLYSREPGTGKTTTAAALINAWLVATYIGSARRGLTVQATPAYFLDVNVWQSDYNEFNRPRVPDHIAEPAAARYYRSQQLATAAAFVVLDDIGVRDATDGFRADLHRIVNSRTAADMPTVYTSNVPMSELHTVFGERRLADRVRDMCVELSFKGGSKRGMRAVSEKS